MLSVPVFSVLRRVTTLFVMWGEFLYLGRKPSADKLKAVLVLTSGAVVAGLGDMNFDAWGYSMVFITCVVNAAYLVLIVETKKATELSSFGLLFYSNIIAAPLLLTYCVVSGELRAALAFDAWGNGAFVFSFSMSVVQAFLLNVAIFLCTTVNSPTTTSVMGQIKNIATTVIAMAIFRDQTLTVLLGSGLAISTVGSVWYAQLSRAESNAPAASASAPAGRPEKGAYTGPILPLSDAPLHRRHAHQV